MSKYLTVQQQAMDHVVSKASEMERRSARLIKRGGRAGHRIKSSGAPSRVPAPAITSAG
jgi:hypothetical protein